MMQKVFRENEIDELKSLIQKTESKKIFLVRANKSYFSAGADTFINNIVNDDSLTGFYDFNPNPQLADLEKGIALFKQGNFELIIAIGGGSVLDMAKLISMATHQDAKMENIILGSKVLISKKTPLLAIPTTAGTGAETTKFAVLYINKTKYSVEHPKMLPDWVYLSSQFSMNANGYLTACTGADAFCQAVESLWSVNATAESEAYALKAIANIWKHLPKAVRYNDGDAKNNMQEASYLAGKAINITRTTAPHALSYAFTSYYNIPHGHAVALTLPFFLRYNYNVTHNDCTDPRGATIVKRRIEKLLDLLNLPIEKSEEVLAGYFNSIGIKTHIPELITDFDKNIILENINFERLNNNPRKVTKEVVSNFFDSIN